jgi:hypothetical protein
MVAVPIMPWVTLIVMPLKITLPTLQEKPAVVYTLIAVATVGQAPGSARADSPESGSTISAAAPTPTNDETFSIVSSSERLDLDRPPPALASLQSTGAPFDDHRY